MTTQISVKIVRKPTVKAGVLPRFPATIVTSGFLEVTKANGKFTFAADYTILNASPLGDPTATLVAVYDEAAGFFKQTTLSALIAATTQIDQHITAAGPVTVLNNAGIVRVDQAVGAPITLNMPLASAKTCPVLIQDWKGDAGTNNITVNLAGSDKFPGGLTSWTIAANTGSLKLSPVSGAGYVIG